MALARGNVGRGIRESGGAGVGQRRWQRLPAVEIGAAESSPAVEIGAVGKVVNLNTCVEGKVAQLRRKISSGGHDSQGADLPTDVWETAGVSEHEALRSGATRGRSAARGVGDPCTGQAACRRERWFQGGRPHRSRTQASWVNQSLQYALVKVYLFPGGLS